MQKKILFLCMTLLCSLAAKGSSQEKRAEPCPQDSAGFAQVQQKAAQKDPAAETSLAACYDLGLHVPPNGRESIRLLTDAADQGYEPAEYELGRIYLYGRGVPADYPRAFVWESKAGEQGDPRAQRDLAFMYERGFGVPADPAKAAEWNRKAAGHGVAEAQLHLGEALESGAGVPADPAAARQWYAKAARQDQPAAQLRLARNYAQAGDCRAAAHWYKEATAGGEAQAAYELGKLFLAKKCGADPAQAFLWFAVGGRLGSPECKVEAAKIAPQLTAAKKKNAGLAADRWVKQHASQRRDKDQD